MPFCPDCGEHVSARHEVSDDGEYTTATFKCNFCGFYLEVGEDDERRDDFYEDGFSE